MTAILSFFVFVPDDSPATPAADAIASKDGGTAGEGRAGRGRAEEMVGRDQIEL